MHQEPEVSPPKNMLDLEYLLDLDFQEVFYEFFVPWTWHLIAAIVVFYVGRIIGRSLTRLIMEAITHTHTDPILIHFLNTLLNAACFVIVMILTLAQLGLDTTSLVTVIGAAGLAIGLALKDSLSNFASGIMLILLRPFHIGNHMEIAGEEGIIDEITIFSTRLKTTDNKMVIIPNSQVFGQTIVNYSMEENRRIDLSVHISYESNLLKAKEILFELVDRHEKILKDPAPVIAVHALAEHAVHVVIRPWVHSSNYLHVRFELLEEIKLRFDEHGIEIPYPLKLMRVENERT